MVPKEIKKEKEETHREKEREREMASLTASSVSVPSFCGLRVEAVPKQVSCGSTLAMPSAKSASSSSSSRGVISASFVEGLKEKSLAVAVAALLMSAPASALAVNIEVGDDVGSFKFSPEVATVAAGEPIVFTLVGEVGHNVIFDTDGAPAPVAAELSAASMGENDLLSEDEPTHKVKISTPGTYTYFCTPHKSANMKGTIIVK